MQNQSDHDRTYEPRVVANPVLGFAVLLALFIPVAAWCGYNWVRASKLESYGVQAPGRISSFDYGVASRYGSSHVYYSFEVKGEILSGSSLYGSSFDVAPSKGDRVPITYDPENPNINSYDPEADMYRAARIAMCDAGGTVGIFIFLLMRMKRK
jgi:hypothetical protein